MVPPLFQLKELEERLARREEELKEEEKARDDLWNQLSNTKGTEELGFKLFDLKVMVFKCRGHPRLAATLIGNSTLTIAKS